MDIESTVKKQEWDAFILANDGCFLQSWDWAEFQRSFGRKVFRSTVKDQAGQIVAQFAEISHELPLGLRYAYVPRGPVIVADAGREHLDTALGALQQSMRRSGAVFARIDFPWPQANDSVTPIELEERDLVYAKSIAPADTSIVDLTGSEEELLAAMHHKTRYNIRLAEKHGVTFREGRPGSGGRAADSELFWRMLSETASRDIFHTHPKEYYRLMLDTLGENTDGLKVKLCFVEHGGHAIAAGLFGYFGDTVTYLHGASVGHFRNLMAPYLLHWEVMRRAKAEGYRAYDLWGIAPSDDADHPWAGITRFKQGFGGETVRYLGGWELPNKPFLYMLYRYARRFRKA